MNLMIITLIFRVPRKIYKYDKYSNLESDAPLKQFIEKRVPHVELFDIDSPVRYCRERWFFVQKPIFSKQMTRHKLKLGWGCHCKASISIFIVRENYFP